MKTKVSIIPSDVKPYNLKIYLKDNEVEFLQKHDFKEEIPKTILSDEELCLVSNLSEKGILSKNDSFIQGTLLYVQLINQTL